MSKENYVRLLSGQDMPLVGFGTYKIHGKDLIFKVVDELLKVGYRSIDTAAVYRNEREIGQALKELLPKYNLKRQDIFITTKLDPEYNGHPENIKKGVQNSVDSLGITYIDLYLIHWPGTGGRKIDAPENPKSRQVTWKTLVELHESGVLKSIGVSNYTVNHLQQLLENSYGVKPAVNQVELHPCYRQKQLRNFCDKEGIHVQAYSSLGTSYSTLLKNPQVCKIAAEVGVSPARLLLKWALQQKIGIIPKASTVSHIADNFDLGFEIAEKHMQQLSSLPEQKFSWDPKNVL